MSGIEDQGLRPENVEPAPADESVEEAQSAHTSQAEGEDPASAETHPDPARPGHPSQAEGEDREDKDAR